MQEIVLIALDGMYAELHRRSGPQWITELVRGADSRLSLDSVPLEIPMAELYDGIALSEDED